MLHTPWVGVPDKNDTYPHVALTHALPFQPNDDLMPSKARNVCWGGENNNLLSLSEHKHCQPKTVLLLLVLHPLRLKRALGVPDRWNTWWIRYSHSWEGVFPLLSKAVKSGLAETVELKEWLHKQSPWRLEYSLSTRGRHFAFSLSGFLISTADYSSCRPDSWTSLNCFTFNQNRPHPPQLTPGKLQNSTWLFDLDDFKLLNDSLPRIHTPNLENMRNRSLKWTQTKLKVQLLCISWNREN